MKQELVEANIQSNEILTMDNGCVCCSVRADLVHVLHELAQREDKFDGILLETTGLADPAPVAYTFFSQPRIALQFRIDSILCLVDCKHALQHIREQKAENAVNEAVHQIAFADRILLNKIDLVSEEEKQEVIDEIRSINAVAELIECTTSSVPMERIFGVKSFSVEEAIKVDPDFLDQDDTPEHVENCTDANCAHPDHGNGHEHKSCGEKDCGDHEHKSCGDKKCGAHEHKSCGEKDCGAHEHKSCGEKDCGDHEHKSCGDKKCGDHEHKSCGDKKCGDHEHKSCGDKKCGAHKDEHTHEKPKKKKRKIHDLSGVGSVGIQLEVR